MQNKIIYITGGASGMGLLTACELMKRGAHIVIFNRQADAALVAVQKIEQMRCSAQQKIASYLLDVAERDQVLAVFEQAAGAIGAPDIVINMAGIGGVATMLDMGYAMFDRIMKINVYGTRNVVEAALKTMRPRRTGQIVLAGSLGGMVPVYGYTAYGTSKFAVLGFAQCLRYELKPLGIDVVCFCPGEVATPGLAAEREHTHPATVAMKFIGGTIAAEHAVSALISGIQRGKFLIIPGLRNKLVHWAVRVTPTSLWNVITDAIVARAVRT
ncbi:MAG: SDR family NAD(P)-dependent oxidoreductase [Pseudomonas sp.]|uniref:SDR family NAD(P)-dependent oxidoreductase n=1 Tax=Pseudomonas sp. TaxID=306 RepID=UPI003BB77AA1